MMKEALTFPGKFKHRVEANHIFERMKYTRKVHKLLFRKPKLILITVNSMVELLSYLSVIITIETAEFNLIGEKGI